MVHLIRLIYKLNRKIKVQIEYRIFCHSLQVLPFSSKDVIDGWSSESWPASSYRTMYVIVNMSPAISWPFQYWFQNLQTFPSQLSSVPWWAWISFTSWSNVIVTSHPSRSSGTTISNRPFNPWCQELVTVLVPTHSPLGAKDFWR